MFVDKEEKRRRIKINKLGWWLKKEKKWWKWEKWEKWGKRENQTGVPARRIATLF